MHILETLLDSVVESAITAITSLIFTFKLLGAIILAAGPMFGIALLVDYTNDWLILLFIPYFLLLPLLCKPAAKLMDL